MMPLATAGSDGSRWSLSRWPLTMLMVAASVLVFARLDAWTDNLLLVRLLAALHDGRAVSAADAARIAASGNSSAFWLAGKIELGRSGNFDRALALWRNGGRPNAERLRILAENSWKRGNSADAIRDMRAAADIDPSNERLTAELGSWRLSRGQDAQLERDLRDIIVRAPRNATALALRGWSAHLAGRPADARADFERAILADPDDATTLQYFARFLGESGGPKDRIERLLQHGDRSWPDTDVFSYELAKLYSSEGRYAEAAPYFRRLGASRPGDPYAREVIGLYYLQQKRYGDALMEFERARSLDRSQSRFVIDSGDALSGLGRRDAALAAYRAAEKMGDWRAAGRLRAVQSGGEAIR